jgi:TrmH family RNA methyltransferase
MPSLSESKRLRALRRRKERRERGEFLLEGPRALSDVLGAGHPVTLVLYTNDAVAQPAGAALRMRLETAGVPCELVSAEVLAAHSDTVTPQGWVAVSPIPLWEWPVAEPGRILVLDAIQDPGNVGTLIRAADALGATGVVVLPGTVDPWAPKVVRAAAGSTVRVPVLECAWGDAHERLRESGTEIWVASAGGEQVKGEAGIATGLALVLGNEGVGASPEVRAGADRLVAVRMRGGVDSLNVALAGAILMDRFFGG